MFVVIFILILQVQNSLSQFIRIGKSNEFNVLELEKYFLLKCVI